jgi:glycosyltransferase involved in cell wall biosynthesis
MSSEYEALPLVLIEAKTFGLPCVSFDIKTGPNEIIRNDVDGFLVPFADCEMLAKKINVLINDEDLRKNFGEASRKDALVRFNPIGIFNKWDDFLDEIKLLEE